MSLGKLEQIQIGVEKVSSGVSGAVITLRNPSHNFRL